MNLIIPKRLASINIRDTLVINSTSFQTIAEHNISYESSTEVFTWSNNYSHVDEMNYSSENSSLSYSDYYDYTSQEYPGDINKDVPLWEFVIKIVLYSIMIVASLVGNSLVIVVVLRNKRMQTATNFYIVNLAVADILVTVACTWVQLVNNLTNAWVLGTFFCKFNSFAQVVSHVSSIFSLMLIACDRFFGIVFAMKAHIIERRAMPAIVLAWIVSILVGLPLLFVRTLHARQWKNHLETWCDDEWPRYQVTDPETGLKRLMAPARKAYYTIIVLLLYFIPILVMSYIYIVISVTIWFSKAPGERVTTEVTVQSKLKKKVIVMLILILAVFGLCWLPLQVCILYSEYRHDFTADLGESYLTFQFVSYTLAFSNSVFNPVIYAGFNENFRKGFKVLFNCYKRKTYAHISRTNSMYSSTVMTKV